MRLIFVELVDVEKNNWLFCLMVGCLGFAVLFFSLSNGVDQRGFRIGEIIEILQREYLDSIKIICPMRNPLNTFVDKRNVLAQITNRTS